MGDEEEQKAANIPIESSPLIVDVVGTARKFLDDIVLGIEAEGICNSMGVSSDKTFLLEGSPGTGKSLSIRALNNDLNQEYYKKTVKHGLATRSGRESERPNISEVGLLMFEYSVGRQGSKYINEGSRIMQSLFDEANVYARNGIKTCIAFDEVDAIDGSRTSNVQTHSEDRKLLETLMKNLQAAHDTPNMYTVLMTNLKGACDEASLRAGRIDRRYHFELPDTDERRLGFVHTVDGLNREAGYNVVRGVDYDELASLSKGFNYADIKQCVGSSVKQRAMEVAKDRSNKIIPAAYVTQKRVKEGLLKHKQEFHKSKKQGIGF